MLMKKKISYEEAKRRVQSRISYERLKAIAVREKKDPGPARKHKKRTKPEKQMIEILSELGVLFEPEFSIKFGPDWRVFDFRVGDRLLIEVDGDFYHANEDTMQGLTHMHLRAKKNDYLKNIIAKKNNFKLLRFWASEINENREHVKQQIIDYLSDIMENKVG